MQRDDPALFLFVFFFFIFFFSLKGSRARKDDARFATSRRTSLHCYGNNERWPLLGILAASYSRRFILHAYYIVQTATHNNVRLINHAFRNRVVPKIQMTERTGPVASTDVPQNRPHLD